jgi:MtaA/CmuA family methyltransferase
MLEGREVDHLPLMPITMMYAADCAGVRYGDYARDYRILAGAQVRTAERYGFDYVSVISDPAREAADFGAEVEWFDDQPPAIVEQRAVLADKSALQNLRPVFGPRMCDRVRGVEELRRLAGSEKLVEGWVEGPCAEAADLRGINRIMLDFYDDPAFVRDLFDVLVANGIAFARRQIDAGADIIGVGDAAASLAGPRIYMEFVRPLEKRLIDGIHEAGAGVRLHICGNTRRLLAGMGATGADLIDLDFPSPLAHARAAMGPETTLAGNIHPVNVLRDQSAEAVTAAIAACHAEAGHRYIVAAGCEVPRGTPESNVFALRDYARSQK